MQMLSRPPSIAEFEAVSQAFLVERDLDRVAETVTRQIGQRLRAPWAALVVDRSSRPRLLGAYSVADMLPAALTEAGLHSIMARARTASRSLVDAAEAVHDEPAPAETTVTVPLRAGSGLLGVLILGRSRPFGARDIQMLQRFARHLTLGLRLVEAESRLRETSEGSGRKRMDELVALADGERRRLHALLENLPVGVMIVAANGAVSLVNREAERLLGTMSPTARLFETFAECMDMFTLGGTRLELTQWPLVRSLVNGETLRGVELEVRPVAGKPISLLVNSSPVTDAEGAVTGAVSVFQDLSPLKQISALQELDQLKAEFIAGVSHELRTPLHYIKGYTAALLRSDLRVTPDEMREFLAIIEHESDKLGHLIEDLLDTSRIEAGVVSVDAQRMDLRSTLRRAVENARKTTSRHDLRLSMPDELPAVRADPRRVEQILSNLLDNAVKYSADETTITVTVEALPAAVAIAVADQGAGIAPEHLPHIFERFYRVSNERSQRVRGSGLGLFICRGLVEAHGGKLWAESRAGEGTRFSFTLPRYQPEEPE